jgi:hypothetical protein
MSTIPETLRQIAERIATLEAERERLLGRLAAEEIIARSYVNEQAL